ncbi:hypothetical protein CLI64_09155 [Nostoc sp. CENA543]|uniref:ATP-grasp domain-containing protein n=1 Tax=Nostoc sp. CENA543 TaxID=1869241 RepID=UPI000CA174A8|nr:ATP-grasp domain-containing protein [Nostoc sp. CENA543]AUT00543.1 hypothetical protein CLI64_09155 [Nostoc sp. CENA543]
MIVLSEASDQLEPSASARDIMASTEAARIIGCRVYYIPQDFTVCETAENALIHIPQQQPTAAAVWIGFIPTPQRYDAIYRAALIKGIKLLNNPEQHLRVQEFDRAYPLLTGLTPETVVIASIEECKDAAAKLGFPVFVKGVVQSLKVRGPEACVANSIEELESLTGAYLRLAAHSRGRVLVRKFIQLRHERKSGQGFPLGREYRLFIYNRQVIGMGYYWQGQDKLKDLSSDEQEAIMGLALKASQRLEVPYVALDIGQLENEQWVIIETGDPQFSGVSEIPLLQLWARIQEIDDSLI